MSNNKTILPRVVRLRDAPTYLGMDIHRFNKEVRPFITVIRIGIQGIGFDRLDLDAWFEQYKSHSGHPIYSRGEKWDTNAYQDSSKEEKSGILIKKSLNNEFVRVLEQARSKKQKNT